MAKGEESRRRACLLLVCLLLLDSVHLKPLEPRIVPAQSLGSNGEALGLPHAVTLQPAKPNTRTFSDQQSRAAGSLYSRGRDKIPGDLQEEPDKNLPFSLEAVYRDGVGISETAERGLVRLEHLIATTALSLDVDHAVEQTNSSATRVKRRDQSAHASFSDDDDKISKKVDEIMQERESRVTEALESTVLQVAELLGSYEGKGLDMSEIKRLVGDTCGQDVWPAVQVVLDVLEEGVDLIHDLASIALLQLHRCQQPALHIASTIAEIAAQTMPVTTQSPREASFGTQAENDFQAQRLDCDGEDECGERGISEVRDIFRPLPSLLATYDTIATAVFAASGVPLVAHHLLGDTLSDVNVSLAANMSDMDSLSDTVPLDMTSGSHHSSPLTKRSSCVDKGEATAQAIISWIPIIGTLYNLISSAVYAGKGCNDVAKERAIEGTIDIVMDVGSAVTFGAGAAAFQGIKTAAKVGIKAGVKTVVKSATKAAGKSFTKVAGTMLKETAKAYKNPIKGAVKEIVETVKAPIEIGKSAHELVKNIKNNLKKTPLDKTKAALDVPETGNNGLWRCKRSPPGLGCKRPRPDSPADDNQEKLLEKFKNKKAAQKTAQGLGDNMWNKYKLADDSDLLPRTVNNELYKDTKGIDLTAATESIKDQFKGLQNIVHTKTNSRMYVRQNIGGETVEYITMKQFNAKDQVLITFKGRNGRFSDKPPYFTTRNKQGVTEKGILAILDDFASNPAVKREDMLDAMLSAVNSGPSTSSSSSRSLASVFAGNQDAKEAALRFIVLTHLAESMPGRIPGMDNYFRGWMRALKNNPSKTFKKYGEEAGLLMGKGDLKNAREFSKGNKPLAGTSAQGASVDEVAGQMSDKKR